MKAEARKNICCRKYSELPFRELMNTVGLTLAQNCVGGTLSSADSGGRFQYRNLFLMVVKRSKKNYLEEKGLIWREKIACWTQIKLPYGFGQI